MFKGIKTDGRSFGGSTSTEGRVKQIENISKYHLRLINTLLLSQLSHKEVSNYTLKSTNGELVLSFQCKDVITPSKEESEGEKGEPHRLTGDISTTLLSSSRVLCFGWCMCI